MCGQGFCIKHAGTNKRSECILITGNPVGSDADAEHYVQQANKRILCDFHA